jgi:hypothetical protein
MAPTAAIAAPVAKPVVQPQPVEPVVAAPAAAAPIAQAPAAATTIDVLPTAGLGALGLLALTGGALAIRSRRRRRAEEAEDAEWNQQMAEAEPVAEAEPAMAVEPEPELVLTQPAFVAAPSASEASPPSEAKFIGPMTKLPESFDLSRFGPHVQDAYRGPTADNPSLSLKYRLSRAAAMDQLERKNAAKAAEVAPVPAAPPTTEPAFANQAKADFMFARARADKKPNMRPAYTH